MKPLCKVYSTSQTHDHPFEVWGFPTKVERRSWGGQKSRLGGGGHQGRESDGAESETGHRPDVTTSHENVTDFLIQARALLARSSFHARAAASAPAPG